jgi:hypothetical protein
MNGTGLTYTQQLHHDHIKVCQVCGVEWEYVTDAEQLRRAQVTYVKPQFCDHFPARPKAD